MQTLQQQGDALAQIDCEIYFVDSTVIRAHQHAAGSKKRPDDRSVRTQSRRLQHQSAFAGKGYGKLLNFVLTPGQAHETPVFDQLLKGGAVKRQMRGRPKQRPKRLAGDKGYSS